MAKTALPRPRHVEYLEEGYGHTPIAYLFEETAWTLAHSMGQVTDVISLVLPSRNTTTVRQIP